MKALEKILTDLAKSYENNKTPEENYIVNAITKIKKLLPTKKSIIEDELGAVCHSDVAFNQAIDQTHANFDNETLTN